jgi:hypothetical protein
MSQNTAPSIPSLEFEQVLSDLLQRSKPHLIVTEQELMNVGEFGEVTITYKIRHGKVQQMSITQTKSWLADKQLTTP